MSTEERITSNPETTELPKSRHRFKLDKRFIQGFIAGILLCAIAFTGFYYGTDGQFFSGDMSGTLPLVTDANFEKEVLKSDRIVFVVAYNPMGRDRITDSMNESNIRAVKSLTSSYSLYRDKVKAVSLDVNNSSETIKAYNIPKGQYVLIFQDGMFKDIDDNFIEIFGWLSKNLFR